MRILQRFVTICILGWWLGGLTFYSVVVIGASQQVIGSRAKVGFITQKSTRSLNLIGAGALALMLWNGLASWRSCGIWTQRGLAAAWIIAAVAHGWLFLLHARLDGLLDFQARQVREGALFHRPHEIYLIATTIEWSAGLAYLLVALLAWRSEDRVNSVQTAGPPPAR
jgi:hypothetical protein